MSHTCHAKGCSNHCQPQKLMCSSCWSKVPLNLQRAVYEAYRPGQCDTKRVSKEWLAAAKAAIKSVAS